MYICKYMKATQLDYSGRLMFECPFQKDFIERQRTSTRVLIVAPHCPDDIKRNYSGTRVCWEVENIILGRGND